LRRSAGGLVREAPVPPRGLECSGLWRRSKTPEHRWCRDSLSARGVAVGAGIAWVFMDEEAGWGSETLSKQSKGSLRVDASSIAPGRMKPGFPDGKPNLRYFSLAPSDSKEELASS
jgi:hypothetical protein